MKDPERNRQEKLKKKEARRTRLPRALTEKPKLRLLLPLLLGLFVFEVLILTSHELNWGRMLVLQTAAVLFALPFLLALTGRIRSVPGWLFVCMLLLLCELELQVWSFAEFSVLRLIIILLLDLGFGLTLALLSTIGHSDRASRIVALVIAVLFVVLYFGEYVMWDAYDGKFMGIGILMSTGAAAAKGFDTYVRGAILKESWRLLLMLIPVVLYGWTARQLGWGRETRWKVRGLMAITALIGFGLGILSAQLLPMREKYTNTPFHTDVNSFGLLSAFALEPIKQARPVNDFLPEDPELPSEQLAGPTLAPDEPVPTETAAPSVPTEPPATTAAPETTAPTEPQQPERRYNELDIDFAALAEEEQDPEIKKLHEYVAARRGSTTNEFTGLFEGKNLIFITAEAFAGEVIDPELTPTLYRLATEGIQFTDYYQPAWGGSTSTGEYANLLGLVPVNANDIQLTIENNMYMTMANRLNTLGYHSYGYHDFSYTYYNRDKTHPNFGYTEWIGLGNGMEAAVDDNWPGSDRDMVDYTMSLYMDEQPFNVYYMTVSAHGMYSQGGNYISGKNYAAVEQLNCSETLRCYLAANLELEYALEDLVARLEAEGIAEDTVIVVAPDHYPYCLTKSTTWGNTEDYLAELYGYEATDCFKQDHNTLIVWSASIEGREIVVDTPTSSLDILPTLLNLFGVEFDSRLLAGRDVFSDAEPLVLWNDHSWKTEKGSYNAAADLFTPAKNADIEEDYVEQVSNRVSNRINFSRGVLRCDYYGLLFGKD